MSKGKKQRGRRARSRGNGTGFLSKFRRSTSTGNGLSRSLHVEALEDRRMLALLVVNNFFDVVGGAAAAGSLRQAVEIANEADDFDQIIFADYLFTDPDPFTITPFEIFLNGGEFGGQLEITNPVEIIGPGPGVLGIIAGGNNRVFLVDDGNDNTISVGISGLTLSGGSPAGDDEEGNGGAILNRENLNLLEVNVTFNFASGGGGGVFTEIGSTTIDRSLIHENTARRGGGGVQNGVVDAEDDLPTTTILNSTISGNTANGVPIDDLQTDYGGGVLNRSGTVNILQSTIVGNFAGDGGGVGSQGFDPVADDPDSQNFEDGFEDDGFNAQWELDPPGSDDPWDLTTTNPLMGTTSARSGDISAGQSSILSLPVSGTGTLTFLLRVPGTAILRLFDGVDELDAWTGLNEDPPAEATFDLGSGDHTLNWVLTGIGRALIDDVQFMGTGCTGVATVFEGFATTNITSSIIVGNASGDVGSIGMTVAEEPGEGEPVCPPAPFEPQINSGGYNLFGELTHPGSTENMNITLPGDGMDDLVNVDPASLFVDDFFFIETEPTDFGGVLPVFMPDIDKVTLDTIGNPYEIDGMPQYVNMAIDRGGPGSIGDHDQRGFGFERAFSFDWLVETEPNNTIATAQDLEDFSAGATWSLSSSLNIADARSIPHATIRGSGDGTFDYYSFYVANDGDSAIFDIDFGAFSTGHIDTKLFLYQTDGTLLAGNDNFDFTAGAAGSVVDLDAYIEYTFASAGTYVIGVGETGSTSGPGGIIGPAPHLGATYKLQVSIENHDVDDITFTFPQMDIGAAEVQQGNFEVNTLVDESDGRYGDVPISVETFPFNLPFLDFVPDFSLREALEFANKNGLAVPNEFNTVTFSADLADSFLNPDPTLSTPAQTILLEFGELSVFTPVVFEGPSFDLEIDAAGNDHSPGINNGDGSRVFGIFDTVEISKLILRGGDQQEFGGAISTSVGLSLHGVTIVDNYTTGRGGGIYVAGGELLVDSSTIYNNHSAASGGGVFVDTGDVTISNSTISGNTGSLFGGGVANADGDLLIRYSTITNNIAASFQGSGVASYGDGSAITEIRSSIVSGNAVTDVHNVKLGTPSIVSLGYNLVGVGNAVTQFGAFFEVGDQPFVLDPMLAPLARQGGPTPVYRLLADSTAIDMGDPDAAGLGNVPMSDQRTFPFDRIEEIDAGGRIDIGAYEVQEGVLLVGEIPGDPLAGFETFVEALDVSNLTPLKETIVILDSYEYFLEEFPEILEITNSVDIINQLDGLAFSPGILSFSLEFLIDDGDNTSLLDVSIDNIRMQDNTRIVNRENLELTNMDFFDNASTDNGGAISHEFGKLTISDSTFIGNSTSTPGMKGGAIYVLGGDLEINNSLLSGNTTAFGVLGGSGGAIYIRDGDFTADGMFITGNSTPGATGRGGGIYGRDSTMTLANAIISGNSTTGSNSEGGGLAIKDSDVTLIGSTIAINSTSGTQARGAAIFIDGGSLDILNGVQNSLIASNETNGMNSSGGAIASVDADISITGTTISRNEVNGVGTHGGAIYAVGGNLTIRDSTISDNAANATGSKGGGIFSDSNLLGTETATIYNSTVSGNTALLSGGGVFNADGLMKIQYSTITENSVEYFAQGGGVASFANSSTTRTEVSSTIISGNKTTLDLANPDSDVDAVDGNGTNSFVSHGYNVIGIGAPSAPPMVLDAFNQPGDQTLVTDPGLHSLGFNGGPTLTHALELDSPALNAGDPGAEAGVGNVPDNDQRGVGFLRVANGQIDVGAFELNLAPLILTDPTDFNEDGKVSGLDFLAWQRGVGKPNATKADGDSNGDEVVDSVDLDNWELAYGDGAPLAASQSSPTPAAVAVVAEQPLPAAVMAEPDSANPVQDSVVIMGLDSATPDLSSPVTTVDQDETAAIDASLAQLETDSSLDTPRGDGLDDFEFVDPSSADDASDDDYSAEDAVFAMLGDEFV